MYLSGDTWIDGVVGSGATRTTADYRRHRGLTQIRKINYLKWYCYLKNSNTF